MKKKRLLGKKKKKIVFSFYLIKKSMLDIVKQTVEFYFKNLRAPKLDELELKDNSLLGRKASIFVTLYISGIVK
jgi:hypothetical protein